MVLLIGHRIIDIFSSFIPFNVTAFIDTALIAASKHLATVILPQSSLLMRLRYRHVGRYSPNQILIHLVEGHQQRYRIFVVSIPQYGHIILGPGHLNPTISHTTSSYKASILFKYYVHDTYHRLSSSTLSLSFII